MAYSNQITTSVLILTLESSLHDPAALRELSVRKCCNIDDHIGLLAPVLWKTPLGHRGRGGTEGRDVRLQRKSNKVDTFFQELSSIVSWVWLTR
ncbi:hypothetical protein PAXRUDRAFT_831532 [Paxillus rubicundulus Ve08.2h10]|uniref:Uncharacterized protein n=1 Tax=Paxillus rubicundulus Ve08.2h10 TaxID=930991 RepID=A0A0D0E1T5_9AGAM|nr:hypothetical protein PAXRUDRAFT_831532 [Paxillus rubicundulus Ve08.2h10]